MYERSRSKPGLQERSRLPSQPTSQAPSSLLRCSSGHMGTWRLSLAHRTFQSHVLPGELEISNLDKNEFGQYVQMVLERRFQNGFVLACLDFSPVFSQGDIEKRVYRNEMTVQQQIYLICVVCCFTENTYILFPECFAKTGFVLAWQQFSSRQFFKAYAL